MKKGDRVVLSNMFAEAIDNGEFKKLYAKLNGTLGTVVMYVEGDDRIHIKTHLDEMMYNMHISEVTPVWIAGDFYK